MTRRRVAISVGGLVLLGALILVLWPSGGDNSPRAARNAAGPASAGDAESLVRELVPRSSNVRCRPGADEWRCKWETPTQSCNATVLRGREAFYAGCSRLISETDSAP